MILEIKIPDRDPEQLCLQLVRHLDGQAVHEVGHALLRRELVLLLGHFEDVVEVLKARQGEYEWLIRVDSRIKPRGGLLLGLYLGLPLDTPLMNRRTLSQTALRWSFFDFTASWTKSWYSVRSILGPFSRDGKDHDNLISDLWSFQHLRKIKD